MRQRLRSLDAGEGLADGNAFDSGDRQNVARSADGFVHPLQAFERVQLGDACLLDRAVEFGNGHIVAEAQRAGKHAADGQPSKVIAVIEIRHEHLQYGLGIACWRRDVLHDRFKQRLQILGRLVKLQRSGARPGVGVEHGEIELILVRVQIDKEIVDFIEDFGDARVRPVDLVDHDDRSELGLERLHQHVARLRQRAFARVHQQHHAVDDFERALDFSAEVAMARRIDNVDLDVVVTDARGLGQNRDAALALQVVRVHDALGDGFVGAKNAALLEHGVDQRGLAVVHVGDDGDVANGFV